MTINNFKSLLDNAAIVASKMEHSRVYTAQQYLQANGIEVTFTATCMFLLGRNVSIITAEEVASAHLLPESNEWLEELQEFVDGPEDLSDPTEWQV